MSLPFGTLSHSTKVWKQSARRELILWHPPLQVTFQSERLPPRRFVCVQSVRNSSPTHPQGAACRAQARTNCRPSLMFQSRNTEPQNSPFPKRLGDTPNPTISRKICPLHRNRDGSSGGASRQGRRLGLQWSHFRRQWCLNERRL